MKQILLFASITIMNLFSYAAAQTLDEKLTTIFSDYQLLGMSVVEVCNNEITFSKGYGLADFENNLSITDSTLYRIASISKSITATALMKLYEQGLFHLDDDISDYLGFTLRNPNFPDDPITFRMVLSHTSSIKDGNKYDQFLSATSTQNPPPNISEYFVTGGAYFSNNVFQNKKPGTYFQYSNANFGLLGTLIEKISGIRFDIFCKQNIFDPLLITASFNVNDLPNICNVATLYRFQNNSWTPQADDFNCIMPAPKDLSLYVIGNNGFIYSPQGGLRISANDLAKYMLMNANNGTYNGIQILKDTTAILMRKIQWQFDGSNGDDYSGLFKAYGLGIHITTNVANSDIVFPDRRTFGHPGEAYGLVSDMYFDSLKHGVIFITNGNKNEYIIGNNSAFYTVEADVFNAVYEDLQDCFATSSAMDDEDENCFITSNPVTDRLQFLCDRENFNKTEIQNILGQKMICNATLSSIDVSSYCSGIYFLKLMGNKKTLVLKFIKQ
ncbi:MAG: serine hydrolase [Chitinophagales bacterium]|nr:serine hydrolase [Chitinophagales bacterium]